MRRFPLPASGYGTEMLHSTLTRPSAEVPDLINHVEAGAIDVVVVRWSGLRRHNAIARFSSMASATAVVRRLSEVGVTDASLSTAAIFPEDGAVEALVGVHSDDESLVRRACAVMRDLGSRPCCFGAEDACG
ncbi:MAG: hypothetical protein ABI658_12870 [Acidimicrobiales bacterium]